MQGFCTDDPNNSECWRDLECASGHKCVFSCTPECGARLLGWAWSDNFGWLSLNADNCLTRYLDTDLLERYLPSDVCQSPVLPYYVQATADNEIKGFAWSDNIGYVCFGNSCSGSPPVGTLQAVLDFDDPQNPQVIGWAQAINLPDSNWFSLNCQSDSSCASSDYQVRLVQSEFNGTCSGTPAQKCRPKDECGSYCCSETEGDCQSESRLTLSGWAWNNNSSGNGLGWLNFNPPIAEIPPWLQTRYGDIYAGEGLTGKQPPGYSATYRILSGGAIERFLSAQGIDWWVSPNFGRINFPTPETRYSNILGQLDVDGLICSFTGGSNVCVNQYGSKVIDLNRLPLANSQLLNGNIYYHAGELEINNAIEFKNGINFQSGAGTIIVDGNLVINRDIIYDESDALTKFRNLASVAWIIKGDLKISSEVKELAGNFIIIGDGKSCSPDPTISPPADSGCGQIFSCGSLTECEGRLTVLGLMMARKFYFKRDLTEAEKREAVIQGSELIIYDGRLLANTPSGLGDFAKALPIWRSGTFSR